MKIFHNILLQPCIVWLLYLLGLICGSYTTTLAQSKDYTVYKGIITDVSTQEPVVFATVLIKGTSIATVSNSEGRFEIKVPHEYSDATLEVSSLGYKNTSIDLTKLKRGEELTIRFSPERLKLNTIEVHPKDARSIIETVLERREENYGTKPIMMTGFYRETIKKRKKYVAVSEAVVEIYKQPFSSGYSDAIRMLKARKNTDATKLDTLLFKLQGGPYTALMLDIVKDPYMILSREIEDYYDYSYGGITQQDDDLYYIIEFKQREYISDPFYYGKIFVHSDNMAIASVSFKLNTSDKNAASQMLIKKKPNGVKVYPTNTNYLVQYRQQGDKWYFSYSRAGVDFKVNWKKKWFNSRFSTQFELAVTDKHVADSKPFKNKERMKSYAIMSDEISGFIDTNFWGEYNVIKPEEPIDHAIEKIRKNIAKLDEE